MIIFQNFKNLYTIHLYKLVSSFQPLNPILSCFSQFNSHTVQKTNHQSYANLTPNLPAFTSKYTCLL